MTSLFFFETRFSPSYSSYVLSPQRQQKKENNDEKQKKAKEKNNQNSHVLEAVDPPVVRGRGASKARPHLLVPDSGDVIDLDLPPQQRGLDLDAEDDVERVGELVWCFCFGRERKSGGGREREKR